MENKKNLNVTIVPCEERHIKDAIELTYVAWQPIFDGYLELLGEELFTQLYSGWKDSKYNRIYSGLTSGRGYVALVEDTVVGFVYYISNPEKKTGVLEENAVSNQFRGLGIAQKMYNFVFDKMREEGLTCAIVGTGLDAAHAPARKAYEKAGFCKGIESVKYHKVL